MNIPKWIVILWVVEIAMASAIYTPGAKPPTQFIDEWVQTLVVFSIATCITTVWFLWKRAETTSVQRFYVTLWIAALVVANLLRHLRPATPGVKSNVSSLGPTLTFDIAGAIILAVWWRVRRLKKIDQQAAKG